MTCKSLPAFDDGPLCGEIIKGLKSQTVPWLFLSLYLGRLHSDLGSKSDVVEADKGVSATAVLKNFGTSMTQKGELRCVH